MKIITALVLVVVLACIAVTSATAGVWRPGENYYIAEEDANALLERVVDHAYCNGIPRFGHRGDFPYDKYVVFDCAWSHNDTFCSNVHYKAIKGHARGYFKLVKIRNGFCN